MQLACALDNAYSSKLFSGIDLVLIHCCDFDHNISEVITEISFN